MGSGVVTVIGFDPSTDWIADANVADTFWRRLIPQRTSQGLNLTSDGDLVNAVAQLPALALPPVGGLFAILGLYILLVGPINYLVLRRLGHREWAWATIPALIAIFAIGAYGFGASLRGSSVIVNEVALVRGAPGHDGRHGPGLRRRVLADARHLPDALPEWRPAVAADHRRHVRREPDGALPRRPPGRAVAGPQPRGRVRLPPDGPRGDAGQPSRSCRPTCAWRTATCEGTVTNASEQDLDTPAARPRVDGRPPARPAAGETATIDVAVRTDANPFGQSIAELIVGQPQYDANGRDLDTERYARYAMINQLTYDPNTGMTTQLPADGAVILAWSRGRGAPGRHRRRIAPPDRHHALLPADPRRDRRTHDLHLGPHAVHRRGRRRDVLRQDGRQHQLRRRAASRSPTGRWRWKGRSRRIA